MLERSAKVKYESTLGLYLNSGGPNGEHAQDAFDAEFNYLLESDWEEFVNPIYFNMLQDLERRGIEYEN